MGLKELLPSLWDSEEPLFVWNLSTLECSYLHHSFLIHAIWSQVNNVQSNHLEANLHKGHSQLLNRLQFHKSSIKQHSSQSSHLHLTPSLEFPMSWFSSNSLHDLLLLNKMDPIYRNLMNQPHIEQLLLEVRNDSSLNLWHSWIAHRIKDLWFQTSEEHSQSTFHLALSQYRGHLQFQGRKIRIYEKSKSSLYYWDRRLLQLHLHDEHQYQCSTLYCCILEVQECQAQYR